MPKIASVMNDFEKQFWLVRVEMKFRRAIDVESGETISFARRLAKQSPGPYNIFQICAIYEHLVANWKYVDDPRGIEYIAPASLSAKEMTGDCDDFAACMAAMIEAIGGRCRIIIASSPNTWHAYTEVFMGFGEDAKKLMQEIYDRYKSIFKKLGITNPQAINFHEEVDGSCWLNLDWTATHPVGPFFQGTAERIIYPR